MRQRRWGVLATSSSKGGESATGDASTAPAADPETVLTFLAALPQPSTKKSPHYACAHKDGLDADRVSLRDETGLRLGERLEKLWEA